MPRSTVYSDLSVRISTLDLCSSNKKKFLTTTDKLKAEILKATCLSYSQKAELIKSIDYKKSEYGYGFQS